MSGERIGDWMQTYTGRAFWPLDPRPEEVDLRDIAHALAHMCRYAGHSRSFYSVAEHSVLLTLWAMMRHPNDHDLHRCLLMHDAAEAYVIDVPRPLKRSLVGYAEIEASVEWAISIAFRLPAPTALVKVLDDRILEDERRALFGEPPVGMTWGQREPLNVFIQGWAPEHAEAEFLGLAAALGLGR